ncbi:flagellar basal body-associated FliL family protein [Dechloromonas sp. A34]|uniref:flagellar basal body-associated FliL family protein n=1 Tax=Dechloromonas sp. A34 TaxID=447588 RepID=UPI002248CAF3|nr:flagellar basal body-associated FliL family protein [Dechloromonas sp. A34]
MLVVVLAGGGAAFMLLSKSEPAEDDEEVTAETAKTKKKDKKKEAHVAPVFINLDAFTVNLVPETGDQYLQVMLSLEIEDVASEPMLKSLMPKIRNNITLLLSSKKASELLPKEGKERLAEQLKAEINNVAEPPEKNKKGEVIHAEGPVKSVLFTSFIIQ